MKNKNKSIAIIILSCLLFSGCTQLPPETPMQETTPEQAVTDVTEEAPATEESLQPDVEADVPEDAEDGAESADPDAEISKTVEAAASIDEAASQDDDGYLYTDDGKRVVDLILFMGQSNMAGAGGNAAYAPKVPADTGYEFRAVSDPTRLYQITEPFGINENNLNAIRDLPGAKKGSLVSAFANRYFELTNVPVVGVSASAGATDTAFWMSAPVQYDYTERLQRAVVWLENDNYAIRHKYVVWLQGESDAVDDLSAEKYEENMDNIIRPLFMNGVEKVFFITPGRTITRKDYFADIIASQINMSRESGYYALGTTILSGISTEYMVDEWHYNQTVLNLVGQECAASVAYYTQNGKEPCLYDYRNQETYIPEGNGYDDSIVEEPLDLEMAGLKTQLE
ncbi:MAG: hypothetical protein IKS87_04130 [Lachnospiraceae bacterium]|nr:hypothetical protein [Lachnospiraceae bacterium]